MKKPLPCTKATYPNPTAAAAAAIRVSRATGPMRTYRCEVCRKWHLTSQVRLVRDRA